MQNAGLRDWLIGRPRSHKRLLSMAVDYVFLGLCFNSALMARDGGWPDANTAISALGLPALTVCLFVLFRVYAAPVRSYEGYSWQLLGGVAVGFTIWTIVLQVLPPGHYTGPADYGLYLVGGYGGTSALRVITRACLTPTARED